MKVFKYSVDSDFTYSEVDLKGERKYFVEGYASTTDEDKAGEILDEYAQNDLVNQLNQETITMDIEHEEWYDDNGKVLARPKNEKIPVAKIVYAERRPKGTWIKAELNKNLRSFNEVWGSIKEGFLRAFSVAFYPLVKSDNRISKLRVVNVTLTGSPVNPYATFTASMKSAKAYLDMEERKMSEEKIEPEVKAKPDTNEVNTPSVEPEKKAEIEDSPADKKEDVKEKKKKKKDDEEDDEEEDDEAETKCNKPKVKAEDVEAKLKSFETLLAEKDKVISEQAQSIAALKAELEKPVLKSIVTEMPNELPKTSVKVNPLDMIR